MKNKKYLKTFLASSVVFTSTGMGVGQVSATTFDDISNSYAKADIEYLASLGIIGGYPDGTFRPYKTVDRETFAAMMGKTLQHQGRLTVVSGTQSQFTDVSDWAQSVVAALHAKGLAAGVSDTKFGAFDPVTREQMAVFYVRAMGYSEIAEELNLPLTVDDANEVSTWAKSLVSFAYEMGFIRGIGNNKFDPQGSADRQAVAALSYRLHKDDAITYREKADEIIAREKGVSISTKGYINSTTASNFTIEGLTKPSTDVSVSVTDGTTIIPGTHTSDDQGRYWVDLDLSTLLEGEITVNATVGETTTTQTLTKDTELPFVSDITHDGNIDNGTDQSYYYVSGTAETDSEVNVLIKDENSLEVTKDFKADANDGSFSSDFDVSSLASGTITIKATVTDKAGNVSTKETTITKSMSALTAPTVANTGFITADDTASGYTVEGTGSAGATVNISLTDEMGVESTTTSVVQAGGAYSEIIEVSPLMDGNVAIRVTQSDEYGNESVAATTVVKKDTFAESVEITNEGYVNNQNMSNYLVTGTGEVGASVNVAVNDMADTPNSVEGTGTIDADGNFSVEVALDSLQEGELIIVVTQEDEAGNTSLESFGYVTKDLTAPTAPEITDASDITKETDQTQYSVTGTGETGLTVKVTITDIDGISREVDVVIDTDGNYSALLDTTVLAEGDLTIEASVMDEAGNKSSTTQTIVKDLQTAVGPILSNTGYITTNDEAAYIVTGTGTADKGIKIVASDIDDTIVDVEAIGTILTDGTFSVTMDLSTLADGDITFTAVETESGSEVSFPSETILIKDTVAEQPFVDAAPINQDNVAAYILGGTAEPGATVEYTISDSGTESITNTITADEGGSWSVELDLSTFADGSIDVIAKQTDKAGNVSSNTGAAISKDVTPPQAPTIDNSGVIDDASASYYEITGEGVIGGEVKITVEDETQNVIELMATVDDQGFYVMGVDMTMFSDGYITVSVVQLDESGNESDPATVTLQKGDSATVARQDVIYNALQAVNGGVAVTLNEAPVSGETVWFAPSGTTTFTESTEMTKLIGDGTTKTIQSPSTDDMYYLYVEDSSGNFSSASKEGLIVDDVAPTIAKVTPEKTLVKNGDTVRMTVDANSEIGLDVTADFSRLDDQYQVGDESITDNGDGTYNVVYTISNLNTITDGSGKQVDVTVSDVASNTATETVSFTLDNAGASVGTITTDRNGYKDGDVITLTLDANGEAGLSIEGDFSPIDSGFNAANVSVTDHGDGTYDIVYGITSGNTVTDGVKEIPLTITDSASNVTTQNVSVELNNTLPNQPTTFTALDEAGTTNMILEWDDQTGDANLDHFELYYGLNGSASDEDFLISNNIARADIQYTFDASTTPAPSGATIWYALYAVNSAGDKIMIETMGDYDTSN